MVEGLSFHVGSPCTNPQNYIQALHLCAGVFAEAKSRGFDLKLLDIGGGFPAAYDDSVPEFATLAKSIIEPLPASSQIGSHYATGRKLFMGFVKIDFTIQQRAGGDWANVVADLRRERAITPASLSPLIVLFGCERRRRRSR